MMNKEIQISPESDSVLSDTFNCRVRASLQHKLPFAEEMVNNLKQGDKK